MSILSTPLRPVRALRRRVPSVVQRVRSRVIVDHAWMAQPMMRTADRVRSSLYRRRPPEVARPLERVVQAFAEAAPDAVFVQVGAHDGTQLDPLRTAILTTRWRGVLVEPVPYVFDRLQMRYGANPRLSLECVAVASEDGERQFHHLPPTTNEWKWYDALGSFRREIVEKHERFVPGIADKIVSVDLPCVTFDTLCRRNGIDELDLLQIDTEGYDLEVLRLVDFDRLRPSLVVFEHLHLDADERAEARSLMEAHGYRQVSDGMDTICIGGRAEDLPGVTAAFHEAVERLRGFDQ